MKETFDFNVLWNFQHIWTCFVNIIRIRNIFPRLCLQTCFCCYHGIVKNSDFLPICFQSFLCRVRKISLKFEISWFLPLSVLKEKCKDDLQSKSIDWFLYDSNFGVQWVTVSKQKHDELSDTSHVISEWEGIFDFTKNVNSIGLKQETVCQIVRFILTDLFPTFTWNYIIQYSKCLWILRNFQEHLFIEHLRLLFL